MKPSPMPRHPLDSVIPKEEILEDLVNTTLPEEQGKWFANAKEIGDLELALSLCTEYACEPTTLNRAAQDFLETNPEFALGVALASFWVDRQTSPGLTIF